MATVEGLSSRRAPIRAIASATAIAATSMATDALELVTPGDLGDELASFVRAMRAANVSPNTILAYGGAVRQFGRWLLERDYPTSVSGVEQIV